MADPSVRAHALSAWRGNSVVVPAATQLGDVLVLLAQCHDQTSVITGVPADWTYLGNAVSESPYIQAAAWVKQADAGDASSTVTIGGLSTIDYPQLVLVVVQNGAVQDVGFAGAADFSTHTVPSVSGPRPISLGIHGHFFRDTGTDPGDAFDDPPSGMLLAEVDEGTSDWIVTTEAAGVTVPSSSVSAVESFARGAGVTVRVPSSNTPPNAPIPTSPIGGVTVSRAGEIRLKATFSDADAQDSPSASKWFHRIEAASTWTEVTQNTPLQEYSIPAGLPAAAYEWQAQYADQAGEWGPRSASQFFTAADPPDGAVLIDPVDLQTITTSSYAGTISTPSLEASEWRLYDRDPSDPAAVQLQPAVIKTTGDLRSHTWEGLVNGTTVWWWVKRKDGGLWQAEPAVAETPVSFTSPAVPTITLAPLATRSDLPDELDALDIAITNPAPAEDEPAPVFNTIYITDPGKVEEPRATFVPPNTVWRYWDPPQGFDGDTVGRVRVETTGDNGTVATTTVVEQGDEPNYYGGGY